MLFHIIDDIVQDVFTYTCSKYGHLTISCAEQNQHDWKRSSTPKWGQRISPRISIYLSIFISIQAYRQRWVMQLLYHNLSLLQNKPCNTAILLKSILPIPYTHTQLYWITITDHGQLRTKYNINKYHMDTNKSTAFPKSEHTGLFPLRNRCKINMY